MFDAFTPAEVARLTVLIASPAYRALAAEDTTYYRAQWLATRIGRSERDALFLLLPATWQVKPATGLVGQAMLSPAKARAYQREFVRRVRALPIATGDMELDALTYRAANAERELGRFSQAAALLEALATRLARADPGGWRPQVAKLAMVIGRRDASFPIGQAMNKNLTLRMGNCNHRRYYDVLIGHVVAGRLDPVAILSQVEPMTGAIDAYKAFDQREPGWIKVELEPAG